MARPKQATTMRIHRTLPGQDFAWEMCERPWMVELSRNSRSIFVGRNYGAIKLDLGEVSGLMLFPAKSVDHWGHIMPMLVVLVMLNTFFVRLG